MTNGEIQRIPEAPMTKKALGAVRTLGSVVHSSFVIRHSAFGLLSAFLLCSLVFVNGASVPDYSVVNAIFNQHCLDCHAANEPEGQLVLESFEALMKGGELGPAVIAGKGADSLLVQMIEGRFEKDGKQKIMPPGKRKKLTPEEIATIEAWIAAGAHGPEVAEAPKELAVPKIQPLVAPRNPINALACSPAAKLVAVARYAEVELRSSGDL